MKKINRRQFIKASGATALASSLAACGAASSDAGTTSTSTADSVAENSNFNESGLPIVNEKMTFNVITYQAPTSNIPVAEKQIFKILNEETNVEIIFEEIPDSAWEQKINLMISTGATPDAIIGGRILDIAPAIDADLLVPIDDYVSMLPNLQRIYETYPSAEGATAYMGDGKHYFYPSVGYKGFATCRAPLFINQTWLDELGLPVPTTTQEYYDTLVAFKEKDSSRIGFSSFDGYFGLMFKDMFGAWDMMGIKNPVETTVRDGMLDFNPVTDNYRSAMEFFHKLYIEGLMDPECITLSESDKNSKLAMEPAKYGSAQEWNTGTFGPNGDQYTAILPLIGPDGAQKYTVNDGFPVSQAMTVFKTCKNPEVLFRYMDQANEGINCLIGNYGPVGELFEVDEDAKTYRVKHTEYAEKGENIEVQRPTLGMQNFFVSLGICEYEEVDDPKSATIAKQEWSEEYAPYLFTNQYPSSAPIPVVDAEYKQIKLLEEELTVYLEAFTTEFILNGTDDDKWASHIQKCKDLQYEKVVAYYQEIYDIAYGK